MSKYLSKLSLQGKTAVVSGGTGLLGAEVVRALHEAGAKVIIADIDKAKADPILKDVPGSEFFHLDLVEGESLHKNIEQLWNTCNGIDTWINCSFPRTAGWHENPDFISWSAWTTNVNAHLGGYCLSSLYVAERMAKGNIKGSIVNVSSIFSLVAHDFSVYENTPAFPAIPYTAIKGGINGFTRFIASKFGKQGIRANTVCPGGIASERINPEVHARMTERTLLKRLAEPSEVASAILFLASDASSYITGTDLVIDGGWTTI